MIKLRFSLIVTSLLLTVLMVSGCNKQNLDEVDLANATRISQLSSGMFPHPTDWKNSHFSALIGAQTVAGVTGPDSHAACAQCHQNKKGIPLNVGCAASCHDSTVNGKAKNLPMPTNSKCVACHADHVQKDFDHYPSGVGRCEVCHTADDAHLSSGAGTVTSDKSSESCYRCHSRMDTGAFVHSALKDNDESCVSCHNPHGSKTKFFLREETVSGLCSTCHDGLTSKSGSKHAAAIDDPACLNCHNPHSSQYAKQLKAPSRQLCLSCHDREIKGTLNGVRTIPNIKAKVEAASQHTGAQGECTACHTPHSSKFERLLKKNFSTTVYNSYPQAVNPYDLCFKCHDSAMLNPTGFEDSTNFRDTAKGKNEHWFHVVDAAGVEDKAKGKSCKICHDPHGAAQPFNINSSWNMNGQSIGIKFTPADNGGQCNKTCHTTRTYVR